MKVKFLQDFQGRETHNIFYKKGDVVEVERETAVLLFQDKRAEEVVEVVSPIESRQPVIEAVEDEPKPTKRGKK